MKFWHGLLAGLFFGMVSSGIILLILISSPPRGKEIIIQRLPTPSQITIYIVGEIKNAGVYAVPFESRGQNIIEAAGGLTDQADIMAINQAVRLKDGNKITIPNKYLPTITSNNSTPVAKNSPIDINHASQSELDLLPGIGPAIAADIIAYKDFIITTP
jgi:competence protein ComEA